MTPPPVPSPVFVPVLPESAPFTSEQRAYLNGFLAGLFSFVPVTASPSTGNPGFAPAQPALRPLTILFGSQTGTSEKLAKRVAREAGKAGFAPTIRDLAQLQPAELASLDTALIVTSTYGDGEPPDNARAFWANLRGDSAPRLSGLHFSVCALGDQNYPRFCQFGRDIDARLEALGARRVHPRQDCDVDHERPFQTWLADALRALTASAPTEATRVQPAPGLDTTAVSRTDAGDSLEAELEETPRYSRTQPYPAQLKSSRHLSDPRSGKDVRHHEILLSDPALRYDVGDALGVWPTNHPELADAILGALGWDGEEAVPDRDGRPIPLRLALQEHYEIGRIPPSLLEFAAERTADPVLHRLTSPTANGELQAFLHGRDVLDLVQAHPTFRPTPEEFVSRLRKLQPRLYSISSSPNAHPGEVHLTVSTVRYESLGRSRRGVASCFLADRCAPGAVIPVFVHANPAFRLPSDDHSPLIMIGPGTGIAPFRAFLEERAQRGAKGRNWLFFGDQHAELDFLYRDDIAGFQRRGVLHRLDLAWSRDQAEKIYVQHRLRDQAADLWQWLEDGATVAVCGDASRMARDVESALLDILQRSGGLSPDSAREYLDRLRSTRRYLRDVY